MTNIFYWHLVELSPVKTELTGRGVEEADLVEILDHVEEIIHHRTLNLIYDNLPYQHHREFSNRFAKSPQSRDLLDFINEKSGKNLNLEIEKNIKETIREILKELKLA